MTVPKRSAKPKHKPTKKSAKAEARPTKKPVVSGKGKKPSRTGSGTAHKTEVQAAKHVTPEEADALWDRFGYQLLESDPDLREKVERGQRLRAQTRQRVRQAVEAIRGRVSIALVTKPEDPAQMRRGFTDGTPMPATEPDRDIRFFKGIPTGWSRAVNDLVSEIAKAKNPDQPRNPLEWMDQNQAVSMHALGLDQFVFAAVITHGVPAILDAVLEMVGTSAFDDLRVNLLSTIGQAASDGIRREILRRHIIANDFNLSHVSDDLRMGGAGNVKKAAIQLGLQDLVVGKTRPGRPPKGKTT